jgi:hypothetical protein
MATTNLVTKTVGKVLIQNGNGNPNHTSPLGSLYIDRDDGKLYKNADGATTWASASGSLDGAISLNAPIGPTATGSDIHNFNDATLANGNYWAIIPSSDIDLTGITAPAPGINQVIFITNGASNNKVKMKNNSGNSLAANRFAFKNDITIEKEMGLIIVYDHGVSRWRCLSKEN